jgi:hypothetical protein
MAKIKFTEKAIRGLKAPGRGQQALYWDATLPGFGVLCSGESNIRSYVVRGSIGRRGIRKVIEREAGSPSTTHGAKPRKCCSAFPMALTRVRRGVPATRHTA